MFSMSSVHSLSAENHKDQVLSGPPPTPGYVDWEREQVGGDYLDMHPANNTPSLTTNPLANTGLQASVLDSNKMDSIDLVSIFPLRVDSRDNLHSVPHSPVLFNSIPFNCFTGLHSIVPLLFYCTPCFDPCSIPLHRFCSIPLHLLPL